MNNKMTRREFVVGSIQIPLGSALVLGLQSCGGGSENAATQTVCADSETMSSSEARMRSSLGYTPNSPDPSQICAGCAYFKGGTGECGGCDLLGGGQVNASGRCDSWSSSGD